MGAATRAGWIWGPYSWLGLAVAVATLVVDQASKWWMLEIYRIPEKGRIAVLPFLDIVFVKNTGVSYGLGAGLVGQTVLASFALLASAALVVWLARGATSGMMAIGIGLIIGGAVGNAIDRLYVGGVVDFVLLHAFGFSWYVFNAADAAIVAGVAALLYDSFRPSRNDAANGP